MIETLEVFTNSVAVPPLPIGDGTPASDPIQILNITGLEPVKADILTSSYGSVDGSSFDGTNVSNRNIVLTVGLNPDWATQSYETLRAILYTYFMPGTEITCKFSSTHMATVEIDGYVESFSPNIFSKDPSIQISIICPEPYFTASDISSYSGLTDGITGTTPFAIEYKGTIPTGFVVSVQTATSTSSNQEVRIVSSTPNTQLYIIQTSLNSTKRVEVSSVEGNKYAVYVALSNGAKTNILSKMQPGSIWPKLQIGTNQLQVLTTNSGLSYTVSYFEKYGGL